mmetsp:Transcript_1132/g.3598  ORF Transcript_1132/g.3598 Transcript_1132/m.3598 type:complete len:323 (-) Transcript_1132:674-1642(-)
MVVSRTARLMASSTAADMMSHDTATRPARSVPVRASDGQMRSDGSAAVRTDSVQRRVRRGEDGSGYSSCGAVPTKAASGHVLRSQRSGAEGFSSVFTFSIAPTELNETRTARTSPAEVPADLAARSSSSRSPSTCLRRAATCERCASLSRAERGEMGVVSPSGLKAVERRCEKRPSGEGGAGSPGCGGTIPAFRPLPLVENATAAVSALSARPAGRTSARSRLRASISSLVVSSHAALPRTNTSSDTVSSSGGGSTLVSAASCVRSSPSQPSDSHQRSDPAAGGGGFGAGVRAHTLRKNSLYTRPASWSSVPRAASPRAPRW